VAHVEHVVLVSPSLGPYEMWQVEHEVLPSEGERFAVTLWIWSTAKDDKGR
jgi:hypothetical protein